MYRGECLLCRQGKYLKVERRLVRNLQPDKIAGQVPALFDDVVGLARLHPREHISDAEGVEDRDESLSAVVYITIYALRLLLRPSAASKICLV